MTAKINAKFFDQLGQDPRVSNAVRTEAEKIASRARASAPIDTGAYRESIHVERSPGRGRVVWKVVSDDPGALAIEARTGNLARAAGDG